MLNKIGINIDPCRTPKFTVSCDQNFSFTWTYWSNNTYEHIRVKQSSVSNALLIKSVITAILTSPQSNTFEISPRILINRVFIEWCLRNSNWVFEYMTRSSIKLHNCLIMVHSKNLERTGSNEICRKFLLVKGISVFGIGHILAIFHWLGKMECSMELLMTFV